MAREIVSNKNISNGYAGLDGAGLLYSSQVPTAFLTTQSNQNMSMYALGNTTQNSSTVLNASNLSFNGLGGVTVGYSNGSVQLSGATTRVEYNLLSAVGNTSGTNTWNASNFDNIVLSGGNNVTLSGQGNTLGFSVANSVGGFGVSNTGTTLGDTGTKTGTWVVAVSGNGTMSGSTGAGGVHTAWISIPSAAAAPVGVSAGTTSSNLATINFGDGGGVSFGLNAGTVTGSWNSTHSHGNPTLALTNISGTTASASNGLTLSLSAGGAATNTQRLQWPPGNLTAVAAIGNGSFSINRVQMDCNVSATRLDVPFLVSIASSANANTWGLAVTAFACVYTKNASTLSSLSSGQVQWSTSLASNTAGGTQVIAHAIRPMSVPVNMNFTAGEYYVGFGISTNTSSAGTATTALGNTWSVMGGPIYSSAVGQVGDFTATTNTSTGLFGGQGIYSAAISTVPPAVSLSAINQTGSYYARANMGLIFRNI